MSNFNLPINLVINFVLANFMVSLILSCSAPTKKTTPDKNSAVSTSSYSDSLTFEQEAAFDALNTLQVSTDQMNRIYSTFPNINQPCYPPDTSFLISQSELLEAMERFVSIHCTNLTSKRRNQLAKTSALAQESYTVNLCLSESKNPSFENGLPLTGTWVLPNILGRRDLTLVW